MNGNSSQEYKKNTLSVVLVHIENERHAQARRTGYFFRHLEKHTICRDMAPLVLSAREHDERGLIIVLLRSNTVRCVRARFLLSSHTSITDGVFFYYY